MRRFSVLTAASAVGILALACAGPEAPAESESAAAPPAAAASTALETYELPAEVTFPEGIAHDPTRGAVYTASAADGLVARLDLASRETTVVTPAGVLVPAGSTTFPGPLGMELDDQDRLWVAGGRLGRMFVVDVATGSVLRQLEVPTEGSLINDVALVGSSAYFTDTFSPTLWRVEANGDQIGDLEPWLSLDGTPIEYGSGASLNGIAATPDGQSLIVVHMSQGLLFRIDLASRTVSPIDTGGADLSGADGLVLDGRTLYVVRQTAVEIATVQLAEDLSSGTVVARFTDPLLAWPATAVKVDDRLLVVNTQFNTREDDTTSLPFTILSVPVSRLEAQ